MKKDSKETEREIEKVYKRERHSEIIRKRPREKLKKLKKYTKETKTERDLKSIL